MSVPEHQKDHPLLQQWLSGTECCRWHIGRSVLFENEHYIVLKHASHASYMGRFSGSATCESYAELYRKVDITPGSKQADYNLTTGRGELKVWWGRISRKRIADECRAMGIEFDKALA